MRPHTTEYMLSSAEREAHMQAVAPATALRSFCTSGGSLQPRQCYTARTCLDVRPLSLVFASALPRQATLPPQKSKRHARARMSVYLALSWGVLVSVPAHLVESVSFSLTRKPCLRLVCVCVCAHLVESVTVPCLSDHLGISQHRVLTNHLDERGIRQGRASGHTSTVRHQTCAHTHTHTQTHTLSLLLWAYQLRGKPQKRAPAVYCKAGERGWDALGRCVRVCVCVCVSSCVSVCVCVCVCRIRT